MNKNPEENSDLDSDGVLNYMDIDNQKQIKEGLNSINVMECYSGRIQMGVIGRTNVGKSSLINNIMKQDRLIVDQMEGTTRDAIFNKWSYKGRLFQLVDTAGLEKNTYYKNEVEKKIKKSTLDVVKRSQVVVLLIDSLSSFRIQDLSLANYIIKEGRGLIVGVNKWDMVPNDKKDKIINYLKQQLYKNIEIKDIRF